MSITEQEARERERKAYAQACMDTERRLRHPRDSAMVDEEARALSVLAYPDPVTYGPEVGVFGSVRRRRSDGVWQCRMTGGCWSSSEADDVRVLALASCVPVTDAEVKAAVSAALRDCVPISAERMRQWLTAARAAMRPEGTQ